MQCQLCKSEVNLVVDPFAGVAQFICDCRTVQMATLGVIDHGRAEPDDDSIAGVGADSGGGSEVAGRDDSAETPERAEEIAGSDEG